MHYIRRLNTKSLPRSRPEETTPNLLGKEIEVKVVLKAEPDFAFNFAIKGYDPTFWFH